MSVPGLGGYLQAVFSTFCPLPSGFPRRQIFHEALLGVSRCCGHCSQNSRNALFFLCEQVLSGPQISRTCLRSSVTHQKSCLPRACEIVYFAGYFSLEFGCENSSLNT